jgi:hypothetical protein
MSSNFIERPFKPVPGGQYDENGFYFTPNGSFWDPDGVYFNREGVDRHGGFYNENMEYLPGPGWVPELMCYEDEKEQYMQFRPKNRRTFRNDDDFLDEAGDDLDDLDELYENVDYEKMMNEAEQQVKKFKPKVISEVKTETKIQSISPDMLFQVIPEDKKPINVQNPSNSHEPKRTEKQIEIDSLFK